MFITFRFSLLLCLDRKCFDIAISARACNIIVSPHSIVHLDLIYSIYRIDRVTVK